MSQTPRRIYKKITPYAKLIDSSARVLEIGPLDRPILEKIDHPNLFYADIHSRKELEKIYKGDPGVDMGRVHEIDFVVRDSYKKALEDVDNFDYIVHSHVLEHMPDPLTFFQDAAAVLKPGGFLCMTIPDKRYGMDLLRAPTTFSEIYDIYRRGPSALASRSLDCLLNSQMVFTREDLWFGEVDLNEALTGRGCYPMAAALKEYDRALSGQAEMIHFHVFTPSSFLVLIADLTRAGLLPFSLYEFYDTQPGRHEFSVVLKALNLNKCDEKFFQHEYERLLMLA